MIDIVEKLDTLTESQIKVFPCHTNRASSIGDGCVRKLVYYRTNWQDAKKPSVGLQRIFNLGNEFEKITVMRLMQAGLQIIRAQEPLNLPEYELTGHPDGFLVDPETKEEYPFDIKSMSPFVFVKVNSEFDFEKFSWTKKYIAQLMVYMHATGKEKGVFIMVNKSTGQEKVIWISYNAELVKEIFEKCESINSHVKAKTLPERISYCDECSEYCPFLHICMPDVKFETPEFIVDAELESMINRMNEIKPIAKEYKELEETIKDERIKPCLAEGKVGDRRSMFIGTTEVKMSWTSKKGYEVKPTSFWTIKIGG